MEAVCQAGRMVEQPLSRVVSAGVTDEEAMRRVGEGDSQALALLFDRYKSRLFAFLFRLLDDRSEAEDLLGEVFLRIYQRRSTFRPGHGFAPWAYRIARNLAIREMRRRSLSQRVSERLEADLGPTAQESVESGVEQSDLRSAVLAALRSLPEEQRSAAILREYDGMDYRQIGVVLGCSEQAARARTYRARLALRAALSERMKDEG